MWQIIKTKEDIDSVCNLLGDFQMSFAEHIVFDSSICLLEDGSIGFGMKSITDKPDSYKPVLKMILGSESAFMRIEFLFEEVLTFDYSFDSKMDNWNFEGGKLTDLVTRFKLETLYFVITSKVIKYRVISEY